MADVKELVRSQQKPALVIVTQPWCGACKSLKGSYYVIIILLLLY